MTDVECPHCNWPLAGWTMWFWTDWTGWVGHYFADHWWSPGAEFWTCDKCGEAVS